MTSNNQTRTIRARARRPGSVPASDLSTGYRKSSEGREVSSSRRGRVVVELLSLSSKPCYPHSCSRSTVVTSVSHPDVSLAGDHRLGSANGSVCGDQTRQRNSISSSRLQVRELNGKFELQKGHHVSGGVIELVPLPLFVCSSICRHHPAMLQSPRGVLTALTNVSLVVSCCRGAQRIGADRRCPTACLPTHESHIPSRI